MPYNSFTSRTDAEALIPQEVSREIVNEVPESSSVMQLARRLANLGSKQRRMPVWDALVSAYFVNGDTGLKQTTKAQWTNKYIEAEELAVIVPIPEAVLDDSEYDLWSEIRPRLVAAFGAAIDAAVIHETNIPATWKTNMGGYGLVAGATAASQSIDLSTQIAAGQDLYDIVMLDTGLLGLVEADGFMVTGHLATTAMRGKLRGLREKVYNGTGLVAAGAPMFKASIQDPARYELDGEPVIFPRNGSMDATKALMLSGQWDQLVYAMRQDITYKMLTEAVITDASGNIVYNLAQQDMVALRAVLRLGFALPNPINPINSLADGSRYPFSVLVP